jgi:catechol 2,3-dioxygenase-like lactoylglutathione lyase family enzyme
METQTVKDENVKQIVPLLGVADIEESLRFYTQGLGFEMENKWEKEGRLRWCSLRLGGCSVMLQGLKDESEGQLGEGVTFYIICEDALVMYEGFRAREIEVVEPFVGNAMWVTGLTDPDGYRLHFESPTETPEGTSLSEVTKSR